MLKDRVIFENHHLSTGMLAEAFNEAWDVKEYGWIDVIEAGDSRRRTVDMEIGAFLQKIRASKRRPLYRFVEEDLYTGKRMFTVFLRFDDPDNQTSELFGWAYIPVENAQDFIKKFRLERR